MFLHVAVGPPPCVWGRGQSGEGKAAGRRQPPDPRRCGALWWGEEVRSKAGGEYEEEGGGAGSEHPVFWTKKIKKAARWSEIRWCGLGPVSLRSKAAGWCRDGVEER